MNPQCSIATLFILITSPNEQITQLRDLSNHQIILAHYSNVAYILACEIKCIQIFIKGQSKHTLSLHSEMLQLIFWCFAEAVCPSVS